MARDSQVTIRITSDELQDFQDLADKYGITRQKLIYSVLTSGLETLKALDSMGPLRAALYVNQASNYVKEFVTPSPRKNLKS